METNQAREVGIVQVEMSRSRVASGELGARTQVDCHLGAAVRSAVTDAARELGVSLRDFTLAAFAALLHRHTQQARFSIAVMAPAGSTGWSWVAAEIGERTTFRELVAKMGAASVGVPAERPGSVDLGPGRGASFELAAPGELELDPPIRPRTSLALAIRDHGERASLELRFDAGIFERERMQELLAQYELLLGQAARAPEVELAQHSLVTERAKAVLPHPAQELARPPHAPVTDAFLACVARWPERVAISEASRSTTYRELERDSRAVAALLVKQGVKKGDVVAVTGPRGSAMVSAMLGILRSGAVLLTLDPRLPLERRRLMLEQAGARRLIALGNLDVDGLTGAGIQVVRTSQDANTVVPELTATELPTIDPESPAYVFFTSGSTGVPKGVLGRHAGLAHFLDWQRTRFELMPDDRASQLTALSFDVVLRDTFLALTSGGTLCIPDEADVLEPAKILGWLQAQRATVLHVVPSLARLWLAHAPPGLTLPDLRLVFFAGEPLTDVTVRQFRSVFGTRTTIVNLYGPTETTLAKCFQVVGARTEPGVQPVGRTLPETQALVLNKRRVQCGIDEAGEIAIRTPFRTLGYLNAPDVNARVFIKNPYRNDEADLLYLTGDAGRYRADGLLEILGRLDDQVKIRGIRVEPGEVEAVLVQHPGVREAVVVPRDDGAGGKALVAYVVPRASDGVASLREFLRARLPEQLVPSHFVTLSALPLNANGKVDRKELPMPSGSERALETTRVAARDAVEAKLLKMLEQLMETSGVGLDDDFFELGGHSFLALELVTEIEKELGARVPLGALLTQGTPRALAELIRSARIPEPGVLATLQAGEEGRTPVYWLPGGGGLSVMAFRRVSRALGADQPVFGLEADPDLERAPRTLEGIAASHIRSIQQRQPRGPYHLFGFSLGSFTAYEMALQLQRMGEEVGLLCVFDMAPGNVLTHAERLVVTAQRARHRLSGLSPFEVPARVGKMARNYVLETRERNRVMALKAGAFGAVVDQNRRAAYEYVRQPLRRFDGKVTIFLAQDSSLTGVSPRLDPRLGWRRSCSEIEVHRVPGDHLSMLDAHAESLGLVLRGVIDAATAIHQRDTVELKSKHPQPE
ncbi:MAG: amino acid adenylation domain-containing protein [Deltaproteobacteria bacterium]|nr:amino acid adenylation domain-containing protein [Deltaproteobacteria bacterium]